MPLWTRITNTRKQGKNVVATLTRFRCVAVFVCGHVSVVCIFACGGCWRWWSSSLCFACCLRAWRCAPADVVQRRRATSSCKVGNLHILLLRSSRTSFESPPFDACHMRGLAQVDIKRSSSSVSGLQASSPPCVFILPHVNLNSITNVCMHGTAIQADNEHYNYPTARNFCALLQRFVSKLTA